MMNNFLQEYSAELAMLCNYRVSSMLFYKKDSFWLVAIVVLFQALVMDLEVTSVKGASLFTIEHFSSKTTWFG